MLQSMLQYGFGKRKLLKTGLLALLGILTVAIMGCGSGGGGGGGQQVTVTGRVFRAETGVPPNPAAGINIGGSTTSNTADGTFSFTAPLSATSAVFTATGTQTLTLPITLSATLPNALGDIYLSDTGYTAVVSGRVVTAITGTTQPVANAVVSLAGAKTNTLADGTFSVGNLPVGLGNVAGVFGKVTATGFEDKPITDANIQFPLAAGANPIGDLLISQPSGSTPLPPYTIKGLVQTSGTPTANVTVTLMSGTLNLGNTTTDSTGTYTFWVVPGTYTFTATVGGSGTKSVNATLVLLNAPVTAPPISF